jgi:NADPH-dependent curcumin reductase CurA
MSRPSINKRWILASRPRGAVSEANWSLEEASVPTLADGEALVQTLYIALDPAMRGWIEGRRGYMPPVGVGDVMRAASIGRVIESRSPLFHVGDRVEGMAGWQEYAVVTPGQLFGGNKLPSDADARLRMSALGITGLTAYFGMLEIGRPQPGETVVVSGAAGATGSIAGQLARLRGCRVIGIAGGPDKCAWLTKDARFDAAIDYKRERVGARLRKLAPSGVDVYFDNVGGDILDAVLGRIARGARVVLCGSISTSHALVPPRGPRNLATLVFQRARMQGFMVLDYAARFPEARAELQRWLAAGELVHHEDVLEGIERAPEALLRLFAGKNLGKQLVRVSD